MAPKTEIMFSVDDTDEGRKVRNQTFFIKVHTVMYKPTLMNSSLAILSSPSINSFSLLWRFFSLSYKNITFLTALTCVTRMRLEHFNFYSDC